MNIAMSEHGPNTSRNESEEKLLEIACISLTRFDKMADTHGVVEGQFDDADCRQATMIE